jgi:hypothetical protein
VRKSKSAKAAPAWRSLQPDHKAVFAYRLPKSWEKSSNILEIEMWVFKEPSSSREELISRLGDKPNVG